MRQIFDRELNSHVTIFESAEEMVHACEAHRGQRTIPLLSRHSSSWVGRDIQSWDGVRRELRAPCPIERGQVERIKEKLDAAKLPSPVSRARKHHWSEDDGEVDSDRVLRGESDFYRETYRTQKTGTQHVSILINTGGAASRSTESLFWSCAAATAVVDRLEEAGFTCEVWIYYVVIGAFETGRHFSYMMRTKDAGEPLNIETLISVGSAWFFRTAGLGTEDDVPHECTVSGYGAYVRDHIGDWQKHIDAGSAVVVELPSADNFNAAVHVATQAIEAVNNQQVIGA